MRKVQNKGARAGRVVGIGILIVGLLFFAYVVSGTLMSMVYPTGISVNPGETITIEGTVSIGGVLREGYAGEWNIEPFDLYLYPNSASAYTKIKLTDSCERFGMEPIAWSWDYTVPDANYIAQHWQRDATRYYSDVMTGIGIASCGGTPGDYAYVRYTSIYVSASGIEASTTGATVHLTAYLDGAVHSTTKVQMRINDGSIIPVTDGNKYAELPTSVNIAAGHLPAYVQFYAETGSGNTEPTYGGSVTVHLNPGDVKSASINMELIDTDVITTTVPTATSSHTHTTLPEYTPPSTTPTTTTQNKVVTASDEQPERPELDKKQLIIAIIIISAGGITYAVFRRYG